MYRDSQLRPSDSETASQLLNISLADSSSEHRVDFFFLVCSLCAALVFGSRALRCDSSVLRVASAAGVNLASLLSSAHL
jgi:hypothetical protein